jgi:exopolysaccharide biosynthesis polyprenyl glycosylphosphotransferase
MIEASERPTAGAITRRVGLRRFLPWTLALTDVALIYAAFALAYWVRYDLEIGPQIKSRVSFEAYQPLALLVTAIMVVILFTKSAYRPRLSTDVVDEVGTIMSAATLTVGLMVVVTAMLQQEQYSRAVTVYLWVLLIVVLSLGRALYRAIQGYCHRRGWGTLRVLVVGATDAGMMAMQGMMSRPDLGYQLAGFVYDRPGAQVRDFGRFRALGTVGDIPALIEEGSIDEVIIALPASAHEDVWPILTLCEQHGVALKLIPDLFEMSLSRVQVDDIAGIPLLDVGEKPLRRIARLTKRIVDVTIAGIMLLLTLPLVCALVVLIRLESRGNAILRQQRVGLGGKPFTCFKLRTMADGADELRPALQTLNEAQGPMFKIRNDPRLTRVGRWMRVWSLDEIPQLINVLLGDMSIVGPRPPLPVEAAEYDARHMRRLEVKPGMTGIWQVSGRSDLPFDEMVMMDIYYVDNWSLALDVRILFRTVTAVLRRRGAY